MSISLQSCPCQMHPSFAHVKDALTYSNCCQPYHDVLFDKDIDNLECNKAETAERLMRTRYSGFVLVKPDYIVRTTLPAQQALLDTKAIETWAKETDWAGLEIVRHTPKLGKRHAQVEFKAYFNTPDRTQAHQELSSFVKVNERWYFLDPTVAMTVTQKQPCICGSGEKFKRCCGVYLG